jgi:hypothetical protein
VDIQIVYLPPADAIIVQTDSAGVRARLFAASGSPEKRLLIAGCDPGISILAQPLADSSEVERVPAPCSSRQALDG